MTGQLHTRVWVLILAASLALGGCRKSRTENETGNNENKEPQTNVIGEEKTTMTPENREKGTTSPATTGTSAAKTSPAESSPPVKVLLETSAGDIVLELDKATAPVTVVNFLRYVNEGFYDGTIFHRVIPGFMIQGGGFGPDMKKKPTHSAIINEASNGLKNLRGTIAMARTNMPHSATSQFFINHADNALLDYGSSRDPNGYAVFGKVVKGMDVVDAIAAGETVVRNGEKSFPVNPVVIKKATVLTGQ